MDVIKANGNWPELKNSILVAAFEGWNDAADAATSAVRYLAEQFSAEPFATLDPEEFYVFTDTRPQTRVGEDGNREITWPTNQLAALSNLPGLDRSLVTLVGVEPDLKWRTFTDSLLEICRRCNVTEVLLIGALVGPVPHTRPVSLIGSATNSERLEKIREIGAVSNRPPYEGPTGIIGMFSARCQQENIPLVSFWGTTPSYLTASPNWKVTAALLEAINKVIGFGLDLSNLQALSRRFENQVSQAVARDEQVTAFVQALEEQYAMDEENGGQPIFTDEHEAADDTELPNAELLIQELEKQIRERQQQDRNES